MNKKEEIKELGETVKELWIDAFGVTGEEVSEIAEQIDSVFHKGGYVISHNKIEHFVVDCIKKKELFE